MSTDDYPKECPIVHGKATVHLSARAWFGLSAISLTILLLMSIINYQQRSWVRENYPPPWLLQKNLDQDVAIQRLENYWLDINDRVGVLERAK